MLVLRVRTLLVMVLVPLVIPTASVARVRLPLALLVWALSPTWKMAFVWLLAQMDSSLAMVNVPLVIVHVRPVLSLPPAVLLA